MQEHGQAIVFFFTLAIFSLVMFLVLKRKITERFAVLWMAIAFVLLIASSVGFHYLFQIARFVGIPYPPSALFLIVIFGLTLLVIELFCVDFAAQRAQPRSHAASSAAVGSHRNEQRQAIERSARFLRFPIF